MVVGTVSLKAEVLRWLRVAVHRERPYTMFNRHHLRKRGSIGCMGCENVLLSDLVDSGVITGAVFRAASAGPYGGCCMRSLVAVRV